MTFSKNRYNRHFIIENINKIIFITKIETIGNKFQFIAIIKIINVFEIMYWYNFILIVFYFFQ